MNYPLSLFVVGSLGFVLGGLVVGTNQVMTPSSPSIEQQPQPSFSKVDLPQVQSPKQSAKQREIEIQKISCPETKVASAQSLEALLTEIVTPPDTEAPDPFSQALNLLSVSPPDRADLMARYTRETNKFARNRLRMLLMNLQNDDVIEFARNLTEDGDPANRADGYALLRLAQETSPSARAAILNAIETEQDPLALSEAVASLMPGESPKPEETAPMIDLLRRLGLHESPQVRAESLIALSRWDRGGNTENLIYNGLTDKSEPIKEAALTVLAENASRTDRVKTALMGVATDANSSAQTRWVATNALDGFSLSQQERVALTNLRNGLPPVRSSDNRGN